MKLLALKKDIDVMECLDIIPHQHCNVHLPRQYSVSYLVLMSFCITVENAKLGWVGWGVEEGGGGDDD